MKIAVTTTGNNLDGDLFGRFGRSPNFIIFNTDTGDFELIKNAQNLNAQQGAGIQSASIIINAGVQVLISGHCGPKAFQLLKEAGVKIFTADTKTVSVALDFYSKGKLIETTNADVEGHWL